MRIHADFHEVDDLTRAVVTIGNFDGFHRGHQALVARARAHAERSGATVVALTFDPHPARLLAPRLAPPLITRPVDKWRLLADAGVERVLNQRFTNEFAALSPEAFVTEVLRGALHAERVVVGHDFTFGAKRAGNNELLRQLGAAQGFTLDVVPTQVVGDGLVASSTKVREFVLAGQVEGAALILGRPYHIDGVVVEGDRRGRLLGFPTANLRSENELLPHPGVYGGWLDWGETPRPGVVNVGYKPTFGGASALSIEAHVIPGPAAVPDLYGRECHLHFATRLRAERRFPDIDALKAQISQDRDEAARVVAALPVPRSLLAGG